MMTKERKEPHVTGDIIKDIEYVQPSGKRKLKGKLDGGFQIFERQLRGRRSELASIVGQFKEADFIFNIRID